MAAQFNKVQPIPISSYGGWYVWNSYANFIDKSGQNYDGYDEDGGCIEEEWAMDMNH